jgi:4'-phosphopantetheinyl transferase EntD
MDGVHQGLFSPSTVVREIRSENIDESFLWPEEEKYLRNVSPKRRWDFVTGRKCAHLALDALGVEPIPVLSGDAKEPIWPQGIVGSITHSKDYAAAAVALKTEMHSLGLDAETDEPLSERVLARIGNEDEINWVRGDKSINFRNSGKILFSAKEATFKAWYPMTHEWLGFREAHIAFELNRNTFTVEIDRQGPITKFFGTFSINQGIILTAIQVPVSQVEI